jgi:hypothetical protein
MTTIFICDPFSSPQLERVFKFTSDSHHMRRIRMKTSGCLANQTSSFPYRVREAGG